MASIYGPPAHKRRRKRAPAPGTIKLTAMQMFWLVVALFVFVAVMVRLEDDAGDPDLADTLRQLQIYQEVNRSHMDPILFDIPKFEPMQVADIIPAPTPPAAQSEPEPTPEPTPKPPAKPTRRPPRPAPEQ